MQFSFEVHVIVMKILRKAVIFKMFTAIGIKGDVNDWKYVHVHFEKAIRFLVEY